MIAPVTLNPTQYGIATKPTLGFEQQLYISTENYTAPGQFQIVGLNSGVATMSVSDQAALAGTPQELMVMLNTDVLADSALTLTVTGVDADNNAGTWVGTFQPPAYALDQSFNFPQRFGVDLLPQNSTAAECKTITNISVTCDATWANAQFLIMGMPSLNSFIKIGTKVSLEIDPKVAMPTAVQDGQDRGRYIKGGEIDVGTCNLTVKEPTVADGISRYQGKRVTGWIYELKENVVNTQNIFLCGLILTPKRTAPEGQEAVTLHATGMFERYTSLPAH